MTNKNKKKEIKSTDQVSEKAFNLDGGVKLDPNNEIESGPEEKLIESPNNDGIVFKGILKKDEPEKPIKGIFSNINAESQGDKDPVYERISFSGNKKSMNNSLPVIVVFMCLFLIISAVGAFYVFVYKNNTKESPQQIINSSIESMRNVKTYSTNGDAIFNITVNDEKNNQNTNGIINMNLNGKIDASDAIDPKSHYSAKLGIKIKSVDGSQNFSVDFESVAFGQKSVYYRINDFDLGAFGIMMGSQLAAYKDKWYSFDSDELKDMPGYKENSSPFMEKYDVSKIMEITGKYETLKFEKDLGNEKTGNTEVYHYKTKLDGMAIIYMSLDILKEIGSKYPEEFESSLSNIRRDAEENYRDLINEGFRDMDVEIWIGKDNRYIYRMLVIGKIDENYIGKFMDITLASARAKAYDAKIKSEVSGMRSSLEVHYDDMNGSYENFVIPKYYGLKPENVRSMKDSYVVWSDLYSTTDKWCADSNGDSGYVLEEIEGYSCPASTSSVSRGDKKDATIIDIPNDSDNPKINISFSMDFKNKDFNEPVKIEKPEGAASLVQEISNMLGSFVPGLGGGELYNKDSDGDGLTDDMERLYGTDINNPDTDGDGFKDGQEVDNDFDPLVPGSAKLDYEKLFSN